MSIFATLAEPNRRRILELLRAGEQPVGVLVEELSLAQPTVSQHLKVLRDAGLVAVRSDANRRLYRLQPTPLAELDVWLAPFRELWADRLDALERRLDAMAATEDVEDAPPTTTTGGRPARGARRKATP